MVRVEGALPGGTGRWTWERSGDFSSPAAVRVVLHGLHAERAVADGVEVPVAGSVITCPPFTELTVEGLRARTVYGARSRGLRRRSCDAAPDAPRVAIGP